MNNSEGNSDEGDAMVRSRKLEKNELMAETEKLLLEKGYRGFHFKELAERLGAGRSTIYEYYNGKDELVTAYMLNVMERIEKECQSLHSLPKTRDKIQGLLRLFMKYSQLHRITQILPMIERNGSQKVKQSIEKLFAEHDRLFHFIQAVINEGKAHGEIRRDVADEVLAQILFNSIQVDAGGRGTSHDDFAEKVFDVIFSGMKATSNEN